MVSMDSTLRSNITVGPPLELLIYRVDSLNTGEHIVFEEHDAYLRDLRTAWQESLKKAFEGLPRLPGDSRRETMRLVDAPGDQ